MKPLTTLILAAVIAAAVPANSQEKEDMQLPELHKIKRATLSPSYSCRSKEEFRKGYENTALFLSAYSRWRKSPEMLFDGACRSKDSFHGRTAGDSLDVITDYGDVPLAGLTASQLFSLQRRADSVSTFTSEAPVVAGHTYGMLINKSDVRGFFYFRVLAHVPNQKLELEYVVMDYQVLRVEAQSPGFSWDTKSSYPCPCPQAAEGQNPK